MTGSIASGRAGSIAVLMLVLATTALAQSAALPTLGREALSQPMPGLDADELLRFQRGRSLFRQSWVLAPASDGAVDGLGPLYNRLACISCHAKNGRGGAPDRPDQRMQSMLVRLSVPGRDAHGGPRPHPAYGDQLNEEGVPGVPGEGRARIAWLESRLRLADGESVAMRRPRITFAELAYGPLNQALVSARVSPHVAGMGWLDSVPDAALDTLARQPKPDGVRGTLNRVWNAETGSTAIGRFGLKANTPHLRQQIAAAFHGDLGITSALYPLENCLPAQAACRQALSGGQPELMDSQLDNIEFYLAHLAPPPRRDANSAPVRQGQALFTSSGCALCHVPSLPGGSHPRFPRLTPVTVPAYTDLLVHDMGPALADGRPDFRADGRHWRTAPLWGIGLLADINEHTGFLHDGRARTLQEAILWHGGEAAPARQRYGRLTRPQRQALLAFLASL